MISLPVNERWFRLLLLFAIPIGLIGGLSALLYTIVTNIPIGWLFGDVLSGSWTGQWWWVVVTAIGGLLVAYLRKLWSIPRKLPSAIELGQEALLDTSTVPKLVFISIISLIFGASLGPSYGIVMMGGAVGSLLYKKLKVALKDREIEREYTRTGMSGSLGAVFSDPLLGTLFTIELSPSKRDQLSSSLPRLIAASLGFIVFFGITGAALQDSYILPTYEFVPRHLLVGAALGLFAIVVLMVFATIGNLTTKFFDRINSDYIRGLIGGALVGLIGFALPLTLGSGNGQLGFVTENYEIFSWGILASVLVLKMLAVSISQNAGFLGGNVFPTLFIGGVAGLFVHVLIPDIPVALSVSALFAAVPGATLSTPLSIALLAVLGIGLGTTQVTPIIVAVIVAQMGLAGLRYLRTNKPSAT